MIPHNFWQAVEKPMKHVLYGDSVAENCTTFVQFRDSVYCDVITFDKVWTILTREYGAKVTYRDGKEYLYNCPMTTFTYNEGLGTFSFQPIEYIMRHRIGKDITVLSLSNDKINIDIPVTNDHSMLQVSDKGLVKSKPSQVTRCMFVNTGILAVTGRKSEYYEGYVYDFEVPSTHNFIANGVLVHNTDSIFIDIPVEDEENPGVDRLISIANEVAQEVNTAISNVTQTFILPRLGVDIDYNNTFFKTELVMDAIMFLDIKKNYAYHTVADNGVVVTSKDHDGNEVVGEFGYKGIPVVKSNVAPLSKKLIRGLVETVAMNKDIENIEMPTIMAGVVKLIWDEVHIAISSGNFKEFSTPCKWSGGEYAKEPFAIIGMRTYNTLVEQDVFTPLSAGLSFPIETNAAVLIPRITAPRNRTDNWLNVTQDVSKINYLVIPYDYDSKLVLTIMKTSGISINSREIFNAMYSKVAHRITDAIKSQALR